MEKTEPYIHWRTILFGETDAAAIVYTPRFADYCMEAAEVWFRETIDFDWFRSNVETGQGTPVVHMEIDFIAPLVGGDTLGVLVRVEKVGRSTVTLSFEGIKGRNLKRGKITSFTARFVYCFTDKQVGGSISIPSRQRERIEAYAAGCERFDLAVNDLTVE